MQRQTATVEAQQDSDEDEETIEALRSRLADLQARKAQIQQFSDLSMRKLYLRWNTRDIEEVERNIRELERKKAR